MNNETLKSIFQPTSKIWVGGLAIACIILIAIGLIGAYHQNQEDRVCGEKICAEFNQEYLNWNHGLTRDTLECTFNYEQFTYPEVDEIFNFIIKDSMKERLCN